MSRHVRAVRHEWRGNRDPEPVIVVSMGTQLFFLFPSPFFANPSSRLWLGADGEVSAAIIAPAGARSFTLADGQGLNPLLRHWGMIIHPPSSHLGFVGLTILCVRHGRTARRSTASDAPDQSDAADAWHGCSCRPGCCQALHDVLGRLGLDLVENSALLPADQ
jgi:hypothetical protein